MIGFLNYLFECYFCLHDWVRCFFQMPNSKHHATVIILVSLIVCLQTMSSAAYLMADDTLSGGKLAGPRMPLDTRSLRWLLQKRGMTNDRLLMVPSKRSWCVFHTWCNLVWRSSIIQYYNQNMAKQYKTGPFTDLISVFSCNEILFIKYMFKTSEAKKERPLVVNTRYINHIEYLFYS